MADYEIPCETLVRLSKVLSASPHDEASDWCNTIRIDDGIALTCNRRILAAELIGGQSGIIHIKNDPALIAQCVKEAPFSSVLYINVNPALRFATCKTTLGYVHPGNCVMWDGAAENELDKWRTIVPRLPNVVANGALSMNAEQIAALASSSPSGRLVFETIIDNKCPTIVRDVLDANWFGMFIPNLTTTYEPAKVPNWI